MRVLVQKNVFFLFFFIHYFNIFAVFIASLGLNVNSTAVIIGAMLISPLMGPIIEVWGLVGINVVQRESMRKWLQIRIKADSVRLITTNN